MAVVPHTDAEGLAGHPLRNHHRRPAAGSEEHVAVVVHGELHRPVGVAAVLGLKDRRRVRLDESVGAAPFMRKFC